MRGDVPAGNVHVPAHISDISDSNSGLLDTFAFFLWHVSSTYDVGAGIGVLTARLAIARKFYDIAH